MTRRPGQAHHVVIAWVVGLCTGVTVAVMLGPLIVGWGLAAGTAVGLAVLSTGVIREPQDITVATALHFALALTVGFCIATIVVTLNTIERAGQGEIDLLRRLARQGAERVRALLVPRWALMLSMVPVGGVALWYRRRHTRH